MSVSHHRGGWEVRWRDATGKRRARRFASEDAARAFDEAIAEISPAARRADTAKHGRSDGVYPYTTADGMRWRFVCRRSDGTQTSKRGFTSERAARDARRRLIEQVERGEVRHTKETFGAYSARWLARRRPYLELGTWTGYEINGRKRLLPAFGSFGLGELSVEAIRVRLKESCPGGRALRRMIAHAMRNSFPAAVVLLDPDGLKQLNDRHGHAAGTTRSRCSGTSLAPRCARATSRRARGAMSS